MWNKEKTKKLARATIKKYGREIAIEGSNAVLGLETHLDKLVAKVMGIDLEIITLARQWREILERAAITEGIDRVHLLLETEENKEAQQIKEEIRVEEVEMTIVEENTIKAKLISAEMDIVKESSESSAMNKLGGIRSRILEDISMTESTEKIEVSKGTSDKELESESIDEWRLGNLEEISLNKSIWAPKKERCEDKGEIYAKVAAIKLLGENSVYREKSLRWHLEEIHI
jgi:hypothetical protein